MRTFLVIITLFFIACNSNAQKQMCNNPEFHKTVDSYISEKVPVISTDDFYKDWDEYVILDARELEEYEISHIPGATRIGFDNPDFEVMNEIHKDKKIVIYCSIGYRSEKIGAKLEKLGYENVYNLYGSIFEWANDGYPLEDIQDASTNKLHGYNKSWSKWIENDNIEKVY